MEAGTAPRAVNSVPTPALMSNICATRSSGATDLMNTTTRAMGSEATTPPKLARSATESGF